MYSDVTFVTFVVAYVLNCPFNIHLLLWFLICLQVKDSEAAKVDPFWAMNSYVKGSYTEKDAFENLNREMVKLEGDKTTARRLFYLALPPSVFAPVTSNIKESCMSTKYVIFIAVYSNC